MRSFKRSAGVSSMERNRPIIPLILHPPHLQYDAFGDAVFIFLADSLDGDGQFHFV